MKTYVEFSSTLFPAYENEEELVNPGRYGKRLAEYLSTELSSSGINTVEIVNEDWGWIVYIDNKEFPLWVGCGNYENKTGHP